MPVCAHPSKLAQIVVQSVENVIAVAEFDVPDSSPKRR